MGIRKPKEGSKEEENKVDKSKDKKMLKKKKLIEGIRGIIRIREVDIEGEKKVRNGLLKVKGIGKSLSKAFVTAAGLNPEAMIGSLNDEQIKKLEDVIKNPVNYDIPYYMLNRISDPQTGKNEHLTASDLKLAVKSDIDSMKKMRSYKGIRHELGLPVRGQRTRSSFRTGGIIGVVKKKQAPGAAPAAAGTTVAPAQPTAPAAETKTETKKETK